MARWVKSDLDVLRYLLGQLFCDLFLEIGMDNVLEFVLQFLLCAMLINNIERLLVVLDRLVDFYLDVRRILNHILKASLAQLVISKHLLKLIIIKHV